MSALKAAVIGCGRIGSTIDDEIDRWSSHMLPYSHAARYAEAPQTQLVAGCDADPEKAETFRQRWGTAEAFCDIHEMMRAAQPDIVSIATQTATRVEAALAAIEHNPRALFIDKPVAENLADTDRLMGACRERGIVVAVNCSRVWGPRAIQARELLQEGIIGDLRSVTAFCGGGLSHMGSHIITFMTFYAGPVSWVVGQTAPAPEGQPDRDVGGRVLLQFEGGAHGYLNMLDAGPVGVELDLVGTKGRIRALNNCAEWELWLPGTLPAKNNYLARQQFPMPHQMTAWGLRSVQDLCECVQTGRKPLCDLQDGRHALEIALAARRSSQGGSVRVDLPYDDAHDTIQSA